MGITFLNDDQPSLPFQRELQRRILPAQDHLSILVGSKYADVRKLRGLVDTSGLLVVVNKTFAAVGPLQQPGKSVCFACLYHWLLLSGACKGAGSKAGRSEARATAELINRVLGAKEDDRRLLENSMQVFEFATGRSSIHPVYPLQSCKTCSTVDVPKELGLRIHCSPLTGIVQKMEITETPAAGAYRAVATWASPCPVPGARPLLKSQLSYGRGLTRRESEQGSIGEALERYSLIYRGDEPLQRGRILEVRGIDPRDILLYSDQQYESRDKWNRVSDERYFVAERFDPTRVIDWYPAADLIDGSLTFAPAACSLMWYFFPPGESEYARGDSIGCGSGQTFNDALFHALLEWIERDAMAIWWYSRARRPAVDLQSFEMRELIEVRNDLRKIGRDLILLDCTTDIGIPTYISVAPRTDGTELLFAGASHPSPRLAAWKAASEVGQLWFSIVHRGAIDAELKRWFAYSIESQRHFQPTMEIDAPNEPAEEFASVTYLVRRLQSVGLRVYAANLSRPDVTLKTVRAIVPGLRHIWNRRGPGRLYDVPVRLGWLESPLEESQLNPICCMI